jgi:hypothetical protein
VGNPGTFGLNGTTCFDYPHDHGQALANGGMSSQNCSWGSNATAQSETYHDINDCIDDGYLIFEDSSSSSAQAGSLASDTSASCNASCLSNWRLTFDVHAPAVANYVIRGFAGAGASAIGSNGTSSGAQLAEVSANITGPVVLSLATGRPIRRDMTTPLAS